MKGDGADRDREDRDFFLSLGSYKSTSRSGRERGGFSGRAAGALPNIELSSSSLLLPDLTMLSQLSRNGLNLLAGGSHGGFSLKPPAVGNLARWRKEEALGASSSSHCGIACKVEPPDVENLTPEECWRLILKLGSRWPVWNGITASQAPQGVMKDRSDERVHGGNPQGRALEVLAHGRPAGSMLPPKWTTQERAKTKAATDSPALPASKATPPTLETVVQQPAFLAKLPVASSRQMSAPKATSSQSRTAPLTIFYAGTVNVCDNVPEDKARLITLFAEKAGSTPNGQAPKNASPQVTESSNAAESSNPAEMAPAEPSPGPLKIISITEGKSQQQRQLVPAKPLPNSRKNSLARFLDSRKRNRPTASCSEDQPTKKPA